jgi:hypothetical protein
MSKNLGITKKEFDQKLMELVGRPNLKGYQVDWQVIEDGQPNHGHLYKRNEIYDLFEEGKRYYINPHVVDRHYNIPAWTMSIPLIYFPDSFIKKH